MIIDELLPAYDVCDRYSVLIDAPVEKVWDTLWTTNICESPVVKMLFGLRGLPSSNLSLSDIDRIKFRLIGEDRYREVVFGLIGKFWTLEGNVRDFGPGDFVGFDDDGFAKCAWSFQLDREGGQIRLTTETRVRCLDDESRYYFDWYWAFVRPFSGWTRKEILATVKRAAEERSE